MEEWNKNKLNVRTDLAVEERESFPGDGGEISGVVLKEWEKKETGIHLTEVVIKNETGAKSMGKPMGTYLTLEAPALSKKDEDYHKEVAGELSRLITLLLGRHGIWCGGDMGNIGDMVGAVKQAAVGEKMQGASDGKALDGRVCGTGAGKQASILVVGLGNAGATPDALGPRVLEHLQMTRQLSLEYGKEFCEQNGYPILSGITPGVMAQTGMETAEIIKGVISETRPDAVIVVDALAARSIHRLGVTIQLSDTGIHPGSGVGNHRNSLTEETLGVPVFAIGVPTVVGAAAIVHDTVGAMVEVLKREASTSQYGNYMERLEPGEQYELIREILEPQFGPMYVTPHNIDERVESLSFTISEAIHGALFR